MTRPPRRSRSKVVLTDISVSSRFDGELSSPSHYEAYFVFQESKGHAIRIRQYIRVAAGAELIDWSMALPSNKRSQSKPDRPWPLPQRPGFLIRRLHQLHVSLF